MSATDPTPVSRTSDDAAAAQLPFVAPCRETTASAPLRWLRKGWADMWSAPRQSLTYGTIVVLLSLALAYVAVGRPLWHPP